MVAAAVFFMDWLPIGPPITRPHYDHPESPPIQAEELRTSNRGKAYLIPATWMLRFYSLLD